MEMHRLHLGCGGKYLSGFVNVDMIETRAADLVEDIATLESFLPNTVELIICEHALEHLSFERAEQALERWFELLHPGGYLVVEVPDMLSACMEFVLYQGNFDMIGDKELLRYPTLQELKRNGDWGIYRHWGRMRNIFGAQDEPGQFHQSGWWEPRLREVCEAIGYQHISIVRSIDLDVSQLDQHNFSIHAREEPCLRLRASKAEAP